MEGATPTTDPEDASATEILFSGYQTRTTVSATDEPPLPGTYSYSLFVTYDEWASGTDERYSDPVTVTFTVAGSATPTPTPTP